MTRLRWKGQSRELLWWLAVPLTLFLGIALSTVVAEQSSQRARLALTLPRERELAKQAGLKFDPSVLLPRKDMTAAKNAAPLYLKIYEQWQIENPEEPLPNVRPIYSFLRWPRNEANRKEAKRLLARVAPQLALAEKASLLPVLDYPMYWEKEADANPDWRYLSTTGQRVGVLLAARAIIESDAGDTRRALRTLEAAARIAVQMPGRIQAGRADVGSAVRDGLHIALRHIVWRHRSNPAVLARAARLCADWRPKSDGVRRDMSARMRAVAAIAQAWRSRKYEPDDAFPLLGINRFWLALDEMEFTLRQREWADAYEAAHLSYYRRVTDVLKQTPGAPLREQRRVLEELDSEESKQRLPLPEGYRPLPLSRIARLLLWQETNHALTHTLIALAQERQRTGRTPTVLPTNAPPDPHSGMPLLWRKDPRRGWILYSVGENGRDDGGSSAREQEAQQQRRQDGATRGERGYQQPQRWGLRPDIVLVVERL